MDILQDTESLQAINSFLPQILSAEIQSMIPHACQTDWRTGIRESDSSPRREA